MCQSRDSVVLRVDALDEISAVDHSWCGVLPTDNRQYVDQRLQRAAPHPARHSPQRLSVTFLARLLSEKAQMEIVRRGCLRCSLLQAEPTSRSATLSPKWGEQIPCPWNDKLYSLNNTTLFLSCCQRSSVATIIYHHLLTETFSFCYSLVAAPIDIALSTKSIFHLRLLQWRYVNCERADDRVGLVIGASSREHWDSNRYVYGTRFEVWSGNGRVRGRVYSRQSAVKMQFVNSRLSIQNPWHCRQQQSQCTRTNISKMSRRSCSDWHLLLFQAA